MARFYLLLLNQWNNLKMAIRRGNTPRLTPPWLAYTDLLSSTLMILTVAIAISTLSKAVNQTPPIVRLEDSQDFRFNTGSYQISSQFRKKLINQEIPKIREILRCYGIDTVEIIGHTDSRPNTKTSNLDSYPNIKTVETGSKNQRLIAGSNADLGLLRALSVQRLLRESIGKEFDGLAFRSYSASSLVEPVIKDKGMSIDALQKTKRRIELRFTRTKAIQRIPRCT